MAKSELISYVGALKCAVIIVLVFGCLKLVDCAAGYDDIAAMNIFGFANLVFNVLEWCLYLLIPVCLLGKRSRWFYGGLFAVVFVLTLIQWYTRLNFDMILTGNWVGIVLNSSRDEIVRYFAGALTVWNVALTFLTVVIFVFVEMVLWRATTLARQVSRCIRFAGVALLACFLWRGHADPIGAVLGGGTSSTLATGTFRSRNYYVALADLQNNPKLPKTLRYSGQVECPPVMVFVLGESATKNRWSLYGYEKQTTPCMDVLKDEVVVFEDLVGSASSTDMAMQMLFTEFDQGPAAKMNCTFAQILNAAGYQCSLFSNQTRWGVWGGVEPFMFSGCSVMKFMGEEGLPKPIYDEVLIPYIEKALVELPNQPSAIFVHLYGSHFPPPTCYPKTFSRFAGEKLIKMHGASDPHKTSNHYDNSIAYTDEQLGKMVRLLKSMSRPAMLVYISDHGESVDSNRYRTFTDINLWEIPMVVWFSPLFRAAYPDTVEFAKRSSVRPLQSERLLAGLVALCQISGYGRDEDNFLSDKFVNKPRKIMAGKIEYVCKKKSGGGK